MNQKPQALFSDAAWGLDTEMWYTWLCHRPGSLLMFIRRAASDQSSRSLRVVKALLVFFVQTGAGTQQDNRKSQTGTPRSNKTLRQGWREREKYSRMSFIGKIFPDRKKDNRRTPRVSQSTRSWLYLPFKDLRRSHFPTWHHRVTALSCKYTHLKSPSTDSNFFWGGILLYFVCSALCVTILIWKVLCKSSLIDWFSFYVESVSVQMVRLTPEVLNT